MHSQISSRTMTLLSCFHLIASIFLTSCIFTNEDDKQSDISESDYTAPNSFEIPVRAYNNIQLIGESESYNTNMFSRGQVTISRGREHMAPDWNHTQFWVEHGEPVIFDISYKLWGYQSYNSDYNFDIVVLANFKPIKFKLKRVTSDDDFPSVSQWLSSSLVSAEQAVVKIPEVTSVGVSIYIPTESLPKVGAYDLRVLLLSRFPSDNEKVLVRNGFENFHQSFTLYYGGIEFDKSSVSKLGGAYIDSSSRTSRLLAKIGSFSTLLRPLSSDYNIDAFDHPLNQVHLGQVFPYSESITLAGESFRSSWLNEGDESVIMVFDGASPINSNRGLILSPEVPDDIVNSTGEFMVQFPVEFEIDDSDIHPIRFVKMAQPFQDMLKYGEFNANNEISNTIFVQISSE